jgi:hypothetical protein
MGFVSQDVDQQETSDATDVAISEETQEVALPDPLADFGLTIPDDAPVIPAVRTLEIGGAVRFTLDVSYINKAEAFYHDFFEMDVVFRAWDRDGKLKVTTEEIDWPALMLWGEYPALSCLQRPEWTILLRSIGRGQVMTSPKLGDAEVPVSRKTLRRLRARALVKGYTVVVDEPDVFGFRDPFAVVWRLVADDSLEAGN